MTPLQPGVTPALDVVVPVYNEAAVLEANIAVLADHLDARFPLSWRITVADNASADGTRLVAEAIAARRPGVRVRHLERKGRGRALREAWLASEADVVAYMDVDLSTNLDSLLPLVAPLLSGHSEVAIGTRLQRGSRVQRQWRRELLSRGYNLIVRALFRNGFSDAQCGFKAMRADVARRLVPLVRDETWFFDTELLLLAERNGMRIFEVPVDWIEDLDTRVDIPSTVADDLRGLARVRRTFWAGGGRLAPAPASAPAAAPRAAGA